MEQYLFTFLNQKYGLKSLVIEWATSIVNSVYAYSNEEKDPDVMVFGRILKNEWEEGFDQFQNYTREIIKCIIREILKENFKALSEDQITNKQATILKGKLDSLLWKNILKRLFDNETWTIITKRVYEEISASENDENNRYNIPLQMTHNKSSTNVSNITFGGSNFASKGADRLKKFMNNKSITFEGLVKVILNFQLEQHTKMIDPITKNFRAVDSNLDGVIDQKQLVKLLEKFYVIDEDVVSGVIEELDPTSINYITYSQFLKFSFNSKIPINKTDSNGNRVELSLIDISDLINKNFNA